jgi:hypothetical protein
MINPRASSSKARCTTSPARPVRAEEICGVEPAIEWALSRSRLYALEPIGIGTGLVERFSGYLMRLAEEHAVNTGGNLILRQEPPQSELFNQIIARSHEQIEKQSRSIQRRALAMLNENPVPSAREAARRLGVNRKYMNSCFPAIFRMFSELHQKCIAMRVGRLRQERIGDIRRIVANLQCHGPYPSQRLVTELLPPGPHLRWAEFSAACRDAKRFEVSRR